MKINVKDVQYRQGREQAARLAVKAALLVLHQEFEFGVGRASRFMQAWGDIMLQLKCDGNDMCVLDDALRRIGFEAFEKEKMI